MYHIVLERDMRKTMLGVLLLSLTLLFGCQTVTSEPVQPATDPALATELPPTPKATEIVIEPDYCVECHTDKEQLIAYAKPEEEVDSESSRAG
jgi:hypothetical protein